MNRLVLVLVPLALLVSACAVGKPKPPTYVSDTGVTLNAHIHSSFGDTEYWWVYGETTAYGGETPHRTVEISAEGLNDPHPVSQPIDGLAANTTYHSKLCVQDQQEDPPRVVCSKDETFTTAPAGGRSGIAFTSDRDGDEEVYAMAADGSGQTNLTDNPTFNDSEPAWSPDGKQIAFVSNRDGNDEIYVMDSDGGNQTRVTNNAEPDTHPVWSPKGTTIMFARGLGFFPSRRGGSLHTVAPNGTGEQLFRDGSGSTDFYDPAWSPDADGVAYGRLDVTQDCGGLFCWAFVASDSGNGQITRMAPGGGAEDFYPQPDWHPGGRRLAYDCEEGGICTIGISTESPFLGEDRAALGSGSGPSWASDGTRVAFADSGDVWSMDASGSDRVNLTSGSPGSDGEPDWSPRPEPLPTSYVAMGDSVTQIGSAQRYPERFLTFLQNAGAADTLHNIGENGQSSGGINGNQLTNANALINDPDTDTTVISIDIGGADILFLGGQVCDPQSGGFNLTACQPTLNQFSANFATTLESLNESLADDAGEEDLMVMAYYNFWSGRDSEAANKADLVLRGTDRTLDCDGTGEQLGLNDRIACVGADRGAKLADAYPPFIGHGGIGDYMSDNLHPNDTGHQVIADTFRDAFEGASP